MDNPEKLSTLGTKNTGWRQTTKKDEQDVGPPYIFECWYKIKE